MKKLNLTWVQFEELRSSCDAIAHAKNRGVVEGDIKNTIITSTWDKKEVEIKLELE